MDGHSAVANGERVENRVTRSFLQYSTRQERLQAGRSPAFWGVQFRRVLQLATNPQVWRNNDQLGFGRGSRYHTHTHRLQRVGPGV
jgi:hypothetical protein